MTNRRDFLKSSLFASIALALPTSIKPESLVNTKVEPDAVLYSTNGVERMRITSTGWVGIGNIMPHYELNIR